MCIRDRHVLGSQRVRSVCSLSHTQRAVSYTHLDVYKRQVYALPSTPSVQLLYYRKDLFESPIYRRMYHETYRQELRPPQDFKEFNQIARFFTKACTPSSPVEYGATMTLGSTGVAGSE